MDELEGSDIFCEDFIRQELEEAGYGQTSNIQLFFNDATVLVTGATGLLGQILIEKLLRSTRVKKIYALIRPKGMASARERINEMLNNPLFSTVRQQVDIGRVVIGIGCDFSLPDLGISDADRDIIKNDMDVVLHTCSTAHQEDHMRTALLVNVRATSLLLNLAKQMYSLKSMVYVSSAYANANVMQVQEKIYPAVFDFHKLMSLLDILDDDHLNLLKGSMTDGWPSVLSFCKHVTEDVIKNMQIGLPIAIIRPSIVISTAGEPLVGWVDKPAGPQQLACYAANGVQRVMLAGEQSKADIVPADYVANAILALATQVGRNRGDGPNMEVLNYDGGFKSESGVPIVNFVSGRINPITWGQFIQYCLLYALQIPKITDVTIPNLWIYSNKYVVESLQWLLHIFPAILTDLFLYTFGYDTKWLSTYKEIHNNSKMFSKFTTRQWKFYDKNICILWDRLNAKDKHLFNFNLATIDWNEYFKMYIRGIRIYLEKESMDTLPQAKKRMSRLKTLYYGVNTLVIATLSAAAYWVLSIFKYT